MEGLATLPTGTVFHGRYRIVRRIKSGGMGAVYEVLDETTNKQRALKVMLPQVTEEPDFRARFEREARITGSIESDHIVHVSDAGIDATTNIPFLVMELLRGEELASIVRSTGPLSHEQTVTYLFQAARGLDKTHAAGVVHRDLKPENLFLTRADDGSPRVKILDFGIAKVLSPDGSSNTTRALGTPKYMAPEQVRSEKTIGPRTDIYALGQVAYALLTGEHYWAADASEGGESLFNLLMKIVEGATERPTDRAWRRRNVRLPPTFDAWFFRATAVDPDQRFERATTAIAALAQALQVPEAGQAWGNVTPGALPALPPDSRTFGEGRALGTPPGIDTGATGRSWGNTVGGPRPRRRTGLWAGLALAALAGAGLVWFIAGRPPEGSTAPAGGATKSAEPEAPTSLPPAPMVSATTEPRVEPSPVTEPTAPSPLTEPPTATSAKRPVNKPAAPATSAQAVATSPPKPASGVADPWAVKPKSTATAAPAPTKPGMF